MGNARLLALVAALWLSALAGGCATLQPAQLQQVEQGRQDAAKVLNSFAEAVADDDIGAAMALLPADVPGDRHMELQNLVSKAIWLELYTGYELDAEAAANRKGDRAWLKGEVALTVPATNARGMAFTDRFVLKKTAVGWALKDFSLKKPLRGEEVDLPDADKEAVRQRVKWLLDCIQQGKVAEIYASLPAEKGAQVRTAKQSFWQGITDTGGELYWIYDDLFRILKFDVRNWPDPDRYLPTGYVSAVEVVVIYDVPYVWPEGEIHSEDKLRMEIFLRKKEGEWDYHLLRLYARGIPGSL